MKTNFYAQHRFLERIFRGALLLASAALMCAAVAVAAPKPQGIGDVSPGDRARLMAGARTCCLPPVILPDDAYLDWPLSPAQQVYAKIDGTHMKDMVKQIVAISEKSKADGNQYWGRIAGTPYDAMTRDWVVQQFKRVGLEQVRSQPTTMAPRWWPNSWDASVIVGGEAKALKSTFALGGPSTPAGGVDVPIVWVGLGTAADFVGRDVQGKAVLIYSVPTPSHREHSALWMGSIARAKKAGAKVVIIDLAIPGSPDVVTQPGTGGFGSPDGGGEDSVDKTTLLISLSPGESDMIRELIGQGKTPSLHLRMDVTEKTGPTGLVMGMLPGTTDENILIEAHTDSYFDGAMDNASGMSEMIALAEYYAAIPKAQRRRNLIFLANDDHHDGSASLKWFHDNMGPQIEKMVVDLNCEHPAQTQTYPISGGLMTSNMASARRINLGGGNGTELLRNLIKKSFKDFGVATYSRPDGGNGEGSSPYSNAPPRIGVIDHTFYHTSMDTPDLLPARGIEESARAYASIIDQVNKLNMDQVRKPTAPQSQGH